MDKKGEGKTMRRLRIILIAHDCKKTDLVEWARFNVGTLSQHELIATAATGTARRSLGLTGLLPRFEGRLFSATDVPRGKSFPDFPVWAREMRALPSRCTVIENTALGVERG